MPELPCTCDGNPESIPKCARHGAVNTDRAEWAEVALLAFMRKTGADREDALSDLLSDLMHWCDRNSGQSFEAELARAREHYAYETRPEYVGD